MSQKILGIIGIIVVAGIALFFFGKAGAPISSATATTSAALIGSWRSTDDTRYSLAIDGAGSAVERYQGDANATATSTWALFTSANPDPTFSGKEQAGVVYLRLSDSAGERHFGIVTVSPSTLELVYLDRGGTLRFTRVR